MALSGDNAGAQAYIIGLLNDKVGGLSETMGQTFNGRMEIFKNTLGEISEKLGMQLLPVLEPVLTKLTDLATRVAPVLGDILTKYVIPAISGFVDWLMKLGSGGITLPTPLMDFFNSMSLWWKVNGPYIMSEAKIVFDAVTKAIQQVWDLIQPFVTQQLAKISTWFTDNGPLIQAFAGEMVIFFTQYILPAVVGTINIILQALDWLITAILNVITWLMNYQITWQKIWADFSTGATKAISDVITWIQNLMTWIEKIPANLGFGGTPKSNPNPSSGGKRASGGSASGLTLVGERGPEVVDLPAGSYVHSNSESMGMGGGSININVIMPAGAFLDPQSAARQITPTLRYALRSMGVNV